MESFLVDGKIIWLTLGQSFICLAIGIVVGACFARNPAKAHAIILCSMIAALVTPLLSVLLESLGWTLFVGPTPPSRFRLDYELPIPEKSPPWNEWFLLGWAVGAAILMLGLIVSIVRAHRLIGRSQLVEELHVCERFRALATELHWKQPVELRSSNELNSPMIWGWSQLPVILIPESMLQRNDLDWDGIFVHELAHLQRKDYLWDFVGETVAGGLFWNPLVWWARSRLSQSSEFACDRAIAETGKSTLEFAQTLVNLARERIGTPPPAPALSGKRVSLKERIYRLLQVPTPGLRIRTTWLIAALSLSLLLVIVLALLQTHPGST